MFNAASSSWQQESPLKVLISRATYPSQPEPNYALNLEVAEYINQKKANTCVSLVKMFPMYYDDADLFWCF